MTTPLHQPVMLAETLEILAPGPGGRFLDCTVGYGGHGAALLARVGPAGFLWGLDQDPEALQAAATAMQQVGDNFELVRGNFRELADLAARHGWKELDGILMDLGVSSPQLDRGERGFSFMRPGPLDMRMDPRAPRSAADLVNQLPERELADVLARYGEEPAARRIARAIAAARPLHTTAELAELVARARPRRGKERTHPATQTFQALRIAVNGELPALEAAIPAALGLLRPGGRLAIITYHSLEDRSVKHAFREAASNCICPPRLPACVCGHVASARLLARKGVTAGDEELRANPRSRSARLRAVARLAPGEAV